MCHYIFDTKEVNFFFIYVYIYIKFTSLVSNLFLVVMTIIRYYMKKFFGCSYLYVYIYIYIYIRGSLNKFPDFFRMGTFIDSTHMKYLSPSK